MSTECRVRPPLRILCSCCQHLCKTLKSSELSQTEFTGDNVQIAINALYEIKKGHFNLEMLLGLWDVLEHDHGGSPFLHNPLIIGQIECRCMRSFHILQPILPYIKTCNYWGLHQIWRIHGNFQLWIEYRSYKK